MTANEAYKQACGIVRTKKEEGCTDETMEFWKIVRGALAIMTANIPAEEAIDILESCLYTACENCPKCGNECEGERRVRIALDMAEEALERQIPIGPPVTDTVKVIKCRDCKHYSDIPYDPSDDSVTYRWCEFHCWQKPDYYCADGEREEE